MIEIRLDELSLNCKGRVMKVINNPMKRRLLDIGLTENTVIKKVLKNYSNNMCAYLIRNALIAIRNEDAHYVIIEVKSNV